MNGSHRLILSPPGRKVAAGGRRARNRILRGGRGRRVFVPPGSAGQGGPR
jgi:hypothetical protein